MTIKYDIFDKKTWKIISDGYTRGVFQLESPLGRKWAKKLKPQNLMEQSDLIALLRPGALESGMMDRYVRVKDGEKEEYIDDQLISILSNTRSCFIYQEQAMEIARKLAGFTLQEADILRYGIGKKEQGAIESIKDKFIDGCKKNGTSEDVAIKVFEWFEKSARYLFNLCLSPSSLVELENGSFKQISEIVIGEKIKSKNGFVKVLNIINNGNRRCVKITTKSGKELICSLDHKLMTKKGMKPLLEIIKNNYKIAVEEE